MTKRAEKAERTQAKNGAGPALAHLVEPMLAGMTTTRHDLWRGSMRTGWRRRTSCFARRPWPWRGPRVGIRPRRTHHHWGTAATELTFGGRPVQVPRARGPADNRRGGDLAAGGGVSRPRRADRADVPRGRQAYVRAALRRAYQAASAAAARRQLRELATWLERNGHADGAASVREGLEAPLTVLTLGLPPTLRRFLATTNCIENLIGTLRHVTWNIKRWRDGDMRRRIGLGLLRAAEGFRRIKRHHEIDALVTALELVTAADRAP